MARATDTMGELGEAHGEESMTAFIHEHLSSILQPFVGRLDKLDESVDRLGTSLTEVASKTAVSATQLQEDAAVTIGLRMDLDKMKRQVETMQTRMDAKFSELSSQKVQVEKQFGRHTNEIKSLEAAHEQTLLTLTQVQQDFKESDAFLSCLNSAFKGVEQKVNGFDFTSVDHLCSDLVRLTSAHDETLQMLRSTEQRREKDHNDLHLLMSDCKAQEDKQEGRSKEINMAMVKTSKRIDEVDRELKNLGSAKIKASLDDVMMLKAHMEKELKMHTVHETKLHNAFGALDSMKASIADLQRNLGLTGDRSKKELSINERFLQLWDAVKGNVAAIQNVGLTAEKQADELQNGTRRISELEKVETRLEAASQDLEQRVSGRLQKLEKALSVHGDPNVERAALQAAEREKEEKREFRARLDAQTHEAGELKATLQSLGSGAEATDSRIQSLEGKVAAVNDALRSLRGGVDLTHEYWKGLTKGVKQTHRSVVGEPDLSTSRLSFGATLPSLPLHH